MLDKMLMNDWISLITALGVIVAMVATVYNMVKNGKREAGADIGTIAEMRNDIKHILEKMDRLENVPERLTKVEESTKQAHKRIDRIEGQSPRS